MGEGKGGMTKMWNEGKEGDKIRVWLMLSSTWESADFYSLSSFASLRLQTPQTAVSSLLYPVKL